MGAHKQKRKCNHEDIEQELVVTRERRFGKDIVLRRATFKEFCNQCEEYSEYVVVGGVLFEPTEDN